VSNGWINDEVDYLAKAKKMVSKKQSRAKKKKPDAFERAVILAYRIEYGITEPKNIVKLIEEHGTKISVSRFSQIVTKPHDLKHTSIKNILAPIRSGDSRREIIYAFAHTVYGNVSLETPGTEVFNGEVTEEKFRALSSLYLGGHYHRVLRAVLGGLETDMPKNLRYQLYTIGLKAAIRYDRPGIGLDLVRSWLDEVKELDEPEIVATCFYYRAALLFGTATVWLDRCLALNQHASQILKESKRAYSYPKAVIVVDQGMLDFQRLNMQIAWLERSLVEPDKTVVGELVAECDHLEQTHPKLLDRTNMLVLKSRLRFLQGDSFRALEDLDQAYKQIDGENRYAREALTVVRARSLRLAGLIEEAEDFLWESITSIGRKQNRLHYKMLEYELALIIDKDIDLKFG
jgi:hypothetical protein